MRHPEVSSRGRPGTSLGERSKDGERGREISKGRGGVGRERGVGRLSGETEMKRKREEKEAGPRGVRVEHRATRSAWNDMTHRSEVYIPVPGSVFNRTIGNPST